MNDEPENKPKERNNVKVFLVTFILIPLSAVMLLFLSSMAVGRYAITGEPALIIKPSVVLDDVEFRIPDEQLEKILDLRSDLMDSAEDGFKDLFDNRFRDQSDDSEE